MKPGTLTGDASKIHSCDQVGISDVCSASSYIPIIGRVQMGILGGDAITQHHVGILEGLLHL